MTLLLAFLCLYAEHWTFAKTTTKVQSSSNYDEEKLPTKAQVYILPGAMKEETRPQRQEDLGSPEEEEPVVGLDQNKSPLGGKVEKRAVLRRLAKTGRVENMVPEAATPIDWWHLGKLASGLIIVFAVVMVAAGRLMQREE